MSGLVSGITKIFTSFAPAAAGAATLGSGVRGVGASLFTAAAANGGKLANLLSAGSQIMSLFSKGKESTLGKMLNGASTVLSLTSAVGSMAAGGGQGVDTMTTGSVDTGEGSALKDADTATGAAPKLKHVGGAGSQSGNFGTVDSGGSSSSSTTTTDTGGTGTGEGGGFFKGLGNFLNTEAGAGLLGGLGQGIGDYQKLQAEEDMREADRQFLRDKEQRITDSYKVGEGALVGGVVNGSSQAQGVWSYNAKTGQIEKAA